ncbi:hypothetical protein GCM10010270_08270 [Streptomyces violaceus]|nr:hypothetical protein GCM10010270_08270 [Streptomyces janthinus]
MQIVCTFLEVCRPSPDSDFLQLHLKQRPLSDASCRRGRELGRECRAHICRVAQREQGFARRCDVGGELLSERNADAQDMPALDSVE